MWLDDILGAQVSSPFHVQKTLLESLYDNPVAMSLSALLGVTLKCTYQT